jgi:hypothetical protein
MERDEKATVRPFSFRSHEIKRALLGLFAVRGVTSPGRL